MSLTAGKIAEVLFENQLDTYEDQLMLIDKTQVFTPDSGNMQNAGNVLWRPKEQHRPIIEGFDMTGLETGIIEETYPAFLGTPKNDFVEQRIDDLRDTTFWERAGKVSGRQQATELNKSIADLIASTGSLYFRDNATSGYDFISEGQAIMNERQGLHTERCFLLNDRVTKKFSTDLAARQTLQGRPESEAWTKGQIGSNVAEFDVYTGSFLGTQAGGADPATTTTAAYTFAPEGGSVNGTTQAVTNIDYRTATIAVVASASYNIGDKFNIADAGVTIKSVGLADKTATGQAMTFTVVSKPSGTSIEFYPKPIAADDAALSTLEKAYANVDTTISSGDTINRLNITAAQNNLFWDKDAIEVVGGDVPMSLMAEFDGMKVISQPLSNGLNMYMIYDANMVTMNLRYRTFVWYGLTMKDPSRAGLAHSF